MSIIKVRQTIQKKKTKTIILVFRNILLIKHIFNTRITESLKVKCGKEIIPTLSQINLQ